MYLSFLLSETFVMRPILFLLILLPVQSCVNNIDYTDFLDLVNDLEEDKKYEAASDLVKDAFEKYPHHICTISVVIK